ncbi:MAG: hypothetical protein GX859_09240 [Corynebacterium humireducens]|jgi:hypothetical protein|uniref:Uncharacterized protein n=1 Tax=Corynebacterium humireducens TaxID=1223514 RepID=A0A7X6PQN0_9CORY|nr:hypothetical protein [Corynebacterium humireducens]
MREGLAAIVEKLRSHMSSPRGWAPAEEHPPVSEAMDFLRDHGPLAHDWPNWRAGADLYAELTPERVATLDRQTTLMLLTSLAREERFCDGTWDRMFECGKGVWLFERWLELTPAT